MVVLSESTTNFAICSKRSNKTNQITISQLCKHNITHIGNPVLLLLPTYVAFNAEEHVHKLTVQDALNWEAPCSCAVCPT